MPPSSRFVIAVQLFLLIPLFSSLVENARAQNSPPAATPSPATPVAATPAPSPTPSPTPAETVVPTNLFVVPAGLEVTVWASTPLFNNPTNIDFDQDGRLWVAEGVDYRSKSQRRPTGDRIVVLEDTQGLGKADKSTVFVQDKNLVSPLGVAVFENKVIVSQPPDLLVYTDVNRDQRFDPAVDTMAKLLSGFNGRNHDHSLHSVTAGPDGLWYWNQGNTGAQFTDQSGRTFSIGSPYSYGNETKQVADSTKIAGLKSDDGHVWIGGFTARMQPDGTRVEIIGHNYRNSYEQSISSLGDVFQSDNDDPPACRVTAVLEYGNAGFASRNGRRSWEADRRPGQDTPTAEWRQDDPGTMPSGDVYGGGSPTGVAFYENGALGNQWRGLLLACEAGRNVIFGYLPKPDGAGFKLERFDFMDSNKEKKFAGSDFVGGKTRNELHTFFRPSDVVVGPDGALYVADWFDPRVGGHQTLDNALAGTIYRIAPPGFKSQVPKLDLTTTEGQIAALKSPAVNVRYSGFARLQAQGAPAVPAVAALLTDENPFLAARAIWLLAQLGPAGVERVTPLLAAPDEAVRLVAYRALRRAEAGVLPMAQRMATDPAPAVRREVALTLRDVPFAQSRDALLEIARRFDGQDRTYLEAFGLGCEGKEQEIYAALAPELGGLAGQWSDAFAWIAWRLGSPEAVAEFKTRALSPTLTNPQRKRMIDALGFVKSKEAALAMLDLASTADFPFAELAVWWLNNRRGGDWKPYNLVPLMRQRGLIKDPPLISIVSPAPPPGPSTLPPVAEILALEGDAKRGEAAAAVCSTCHKIGSTGSDLGPDLTAFGKTQPREVIINALLNPSAEISHGFEGSHLETNDGLGIDGIIIATGDPVGIKSIGGIKQTVAADRVKAITPLGRSLMMSAEQLGLTPQSLADIASYLQSLAPK